VDRRADVYGVGAILYELLTGTQINLDLENLAHLGKEGWPHLAPPSQVRPEVPVELDALVFKALAFDREARFETCAAMEDALEQVAARHGLEAGDKLLLGWVEKEMAFAEARAAQGGAAS
jgi:serine/threonine-protein kinase